MRILILGGTVFLGRALVEAALAGGHELTLYNRGRSNPDLFKDVEQIHGDRAEGMQKLAGRRWEAAIDTSGYQPEVVRTSAEGLAGFVDHYTFISSVSVYADLSQPGIREDAPLALLKEPADENDDNYGPLKALCEQAAQAAMPRRVLIVRPGLIVGPHDPSDRFTYWLYRIAQGGEVLAPGRPDRGVQIIDVRDLADWILRMVAANQTGVYNATGPEAPLPMGRFLEICRTTSATDAQLIWVDEAFLLVHKVGAWMELPLWLPEIEPEYRGLFAVDVSKALQTGLSFRPIEETVANTLLWAASRPPDRTWRAGLNKEREAELLALWKAKG